MKEAGARLAAAEFRAQAAGKLADPAAAIEFLDMTKFIDEDGEPDTGAIADAVDKLVAATAPTSGKPRPPIVPNGVQPPTEESDWLRTVAKR